VLARTNVMAAWLGEICLACSNACLVVDEQDHGLVAHFPPDAVDFPHLEPTDYRTESFHPDLGVAWRASRPGSAWRLGT
jgi:uncharacterized protein (DUF427 family)